MWRRYFILRALRRYQYKLWDPKEIEQYRSKGVEMSIFSRYIQMHHWILKPFWFKLPRFVCKFYAKNRLSDDKDPFKRINNRVGSHSRINIQTCIDECVGDLILKTDESYIDFFDKEVKTSFLKLKKEGRKQSHFVGFANKALEDHGALVSFVTGGAFVAILGFVWFVIKMLSGIN